MSRTEAIAAPAGYATVAIDAVKHGEHPLNPDPSAPLLNVVLIALVAMATLGLAGATSFSPRRGRAIAAGITLAIVVAGALWVSYRAFISPI